MPKKDVDSELELLLKNAEWDDMSLECIFDPHQPRIWQWRREEFGPAISNIRRLIGTPQDPEKITKPEELLYAIEYWLQFTNVFSQDKSLKKTDCIILVRKGFELAKKVKVTLKEPPASSFSASEATQALERICEEIYQMDKSLRKAEPIRTKLGNKRTSNETATENHSGYVFIKEGDFWTIIFESKKLDPVKNLGGFVYIQYLLQFPGREINAFELSLLNNPAHSKDLPKESTTSDPEDEYLISNVFSHAGNDTDSAALKEYRVRLEEISDEIDEAEKTDNEKKAAELLEEKDALVKEIISSTRKGGRPRKSKDIANKARMAVTAAIKRSRDHLAKHHSPELSSHLKKFIKTGIKCSYNPERGVDWTT